MFTTTRLVAAIATVAALAAPAGASATTCTYTPNNDRVVLALTAPAPNGFVTLSRQGNAIVAKNGPVTAAPLPCGAATVNNTERIVVTGTAQADHLIIETTNGRFEPGTTPEGGFSEIEIFVDLIAPAGQDTVEIVGSARDDLLVAGRTNPGRQHVAVNNDGDSDIQIDGQVNELTLRGLAGNDLLLGRGGFGVPNAYSDTLRLAGGTGNDMLFGSEGDDDLAGGPDTDVFFAFGGVDRINAQDGHGEVVDTGGGADNVLSRTRSTWCSDLPAGTARGRAAAGLPWARRPTPWSGSDAPLAALEAQRLRRVARRAIAPLHRPARHREGRARLAVAATNGAGVLLHDVGHVVERPQQPGAPLLVLAAHRQRRSSDAWRRASSTRAKSCDAAVLSPP